MSKRCPEPSARITKIPHTLPSWSERKKMELPSSDQTGCPVLPLRKVNWVRPVLSGLTTNMFVCPCPLSA